MFRFFNFVFCLFCLTAFSQIQLADSTVQVVTYFDKGDKEFYNIDFNRIKIKDGDTISNNKISYNVEINVIDETENSYTMEWIYKEFQGVPTDLQSLLSSFMTKNKVIYKTDELGSFEEVLNWKDIVENNKKMYSNFSKLFKDNPEMQKVLEQVKSTLNTKESIENMYCKDIKQFHYFHGIKLTMGETIEEVIQVPNNFGGEPFTADVICYLQSIISEEDAYVVRAIQEVSGEQLAKATKEFIIKLNPKLANEPMPEGIFDSLQNEIETGTAFHNSGWPLYSVQTITVDLEGNRVIEERIIEILEKTD
jgi:hypothetical protein